MINNRFENHRTTGVERYAHEVARRLPGEMHFAAPHRKTTGWAGHVWEQLVLPGLVGEHLLWSPANSGPLLVERQVVTIHDGFVLDHPEWYRKTFHSWYRLILPRLARKAMRIVTSSEYSRQRLVKLLHIPLEKVRVAPGGVDRSKFFPWPEAQKTRFREALGLPARYVLFVGSIEPRKNLNRLETAWDRVHGQHADVKLVIAGGSGLSFSGEFKPCLHSIRSLGYQDESRLVGLYAGASAFVLPSLDEGFGLPLLEAMACGTPVVAAAAGAIPEVVGDAALLVDPFDPFDIARGLDTILSEPDLCHELVEKGFSRAAQYSWERSAEVVQQVLAEVAA
ncbi:MAG: glycosyltransferase family 1 protein, partial [Anaerolineaceae bacterium]|nr:glycosyltransferase family 1 protein [Anaerolineaceae bacterium]